jgi:hypothetical protein
MTRTHSKLITIVVLLVLLISPSLVLAQVSPRGSGQVQKSMESAICVKVESGASHLIQNLTQREQQLTSRQSDRLNNLNTRQNNRATKLGDLQTQAQNRFDEQYQKLLAKAQTNQEKQAVADFRTAIAAAWAAEKQAIQSAITSWQSDVQQAIASRDGAVATAVSAYKNSVQQAIDQAMTDCNAGTNPATVRSTLMTSLAAARDKFKSDRQAIDKLNDTLTTERTTRQTDVQNAVSTFKTAVQTATATLKSVLGESTTTGSDSSQNSD